MISLFFTFLLGLFCCSGVVNNRLEQTNNELNIVDSINKKSSIDYNDQLYIFTSTYDVTNVIGYLCDTYDFFNFTIDQYVDTYFYNQSGGYSKFCYYSHFDVDNWTQSQFDYNLSYVRSTLKATYFIMGANNHSYPAFNVWFEFKAPDGTTFLNYHTDLFTRMNSSGQYVYNGYAINYSTSDIYGGWFIVDKYTDAFAYDCFRYNDREYNYVRGVETAQSDYYNSGWQAGYASGYVEGSAVDSTASTIFTGILNVALIPVNVFLTFFNFEIFGINISGIVSGILTLSVVVIIFRFLFGGNKDD